MGKHLRDPETDPDIVFQHRLVEATGRTRKKWFSLLDRAGAQLWDERRIVRWLGGRRDADAWWARPLAREYVANRQRSNETIAALVANAAADSLAPALSSGLRVTESVVIEAAADTVWPFIADDDARREWLDVEFEVLDVRAGEQKSVVHLIADDASRISLRLYPHPVGAGGVPRCRVEVSHSRLLRTSMVMETRAFWRTALEQLVAVVEEEEV